MGALLITVALFLASITVAMACDINNSGTNFTRSDPDGSGAHILGLAGSYAALAASTITNVGFTSLTGDIGTSPGDAITGFGPGSFTGEMHAGDADSLLAADDLVDAYNFLKDLPCNTELSGTNLGGLTLAPGVYLFTGSASLNSVALTLQGNSSEYDAWVFQIASTLTTASGAKVILTNGGKSSNVFWQVGSSATLGSGTQFVGSILALASITFNTEATLDGRALARNGAVSLITNAIVVPTGIQFDCNSTTITPNITTNADAINATTTSLAVTCTGLSCPAALEFFGLPFDFTGSGAGSAACESVFDVSATGFTCNISGELNPSGGNLVLLIKTLAQNTTCVGVSSSTIIAVVNGDGSGDGDSDNVAVPLQGPYTFLRIMCYSLLELFI